MSKGRDIHLKADERGRVAFYAELNGEIRRCQAWIDPYDREMLILVSGDVLDGVDDLNTYFSAGVYTSLIGFRRGDRLDFSAVVDAAKGHRS